MRPAFSVAPASTACQVAYDVNSLWATPIFRSTHSIASQLPVEIAVSGMFPSASVDGMLKTPAAAPASLCSLAVTVVQALAAGMALIVNSRRHLPSWMTSGNGIPTGTFGSVKVPLYAVVVETRGVPETSAPHWTQEICGRFGFVSNEVSGVVGMNTRTPGTGSGEPVFQ